MALGLDSRTNVVRESAATWTDYVKGSESMRQCTRPQHGLGAAQPHSTKAYICRLSVSPLIVYFPCAFFRQCSDSSLLTASRHYLLPAAASIPCFAVWTYVGSHESFGSIKPILCQLLNPLHWLTDPPPCMGHRTSCRRRNSCCCSVHCQYHRTSGEKLAHPNHHLDVNSLVDFSHPRQTMVRSRLLCCMCHVSVHADRLRKSAALATLGSSQT